VSQSKNRKQRYGITEEDFEKLWEDCDGCCMLCGEPMLRTGRKANSVHIDHCHVTGKVRGLLHNTCNSGLGKFKDDVELLAKAIAYIARNGSGVFKRTLD